MKMESMQQKEIKRVFRSFKFIPFSRMLFATWTTISHLPKLHVRIQSLQSFSGVLSGLVSVNTLFPRFAKACYLLPLWFSISELLLLWSYFLHFFIYNHKTKNNDSWSYGTKTRKVQIFSQKERVACRYRLSSCRH